MVLTVLLFWRPVSRQATMWVRLIFRRNGIDCPAVMCADCCQSFPVRSMPISARLLLGRPSFGRSVFKVFMQEVNASLGRLPDARKKANVTV